MLIRDGKKRAKGVWRWGEREIIYLSLHCHHQNDSCINMGSDESHFNVSLIVIFVLFCLFVCLLLSFWSFVCFVASDVLTIICHLAIVGVCVIVVLYIGNTQISILLLRFLYLFVELVITMSE